MATPDTLLLEYALSTQPQPLQSGDETIQSNGTVNLHIASATAPLAYANQITLAVPVGDGGAFQQVPTCSVNTGRWLLTSSKRVDGGTLGLQVGQDYATFTLNCQAASDYQISYNLVVALTGAVSKSQGSYLLQVLENSGTTSDPLSFTSKKGAFTLSVVPPQFYLQNLIAYATGAPTVPRSEYPIGTDINLAWESNGTWFQVFKKGDTTPFWAGTGTTCTLAGGVGTDTTFIIVGAMTGAPGEDIAGFPTIILYDALTVTISNPTLTPTSVTTSADVAVGANLTVAGTTTLSGQATLGAASANTLATSGQATLASASVTGALGVGGATTLAQALVNNGLTVNGGATVNGGLTSTANFVSMMTSAISVSPGNYTAATDGFVIGVVTAPSDVTQHSIGWVFGWTGGLSLNATGGNVGSFDTDWNKWRSSNNNSFAMPVQKGAAWSISVAQGSGNQVAANTAFYWVSIGANAGQSTFTKVSDQVPPPGPLPQMVQRISKSKDAYVAELIEVIGQIAPKPLAGTLRARLLHVLTKLNCDEYEERRP